MTGATHTSVLVVDDDQTIAETIGRYLRRAGYDVRLAHNGITALALQQEQPADLLVLDVMLPGIDGLEVLRRLSRLPAGPRVILVTARGDENDRVTGLSVGADDYVVKPFSPRELVARVDAVLRRGAPTAAPDIPASIEIGDLLVSGTIPHQRAGKPANEPARTVTGGRNELAGPDRAVLPEPRSRGYVCR